MTDVAAGRYAGTRVHRVEDARLLTGAGTYVDDVTRPGMLHACFVRSYLARARILSIDTSEALALPGVHAVFTADDLLPDAHQAWFTLGGKDEQDVPRPPLAVGEARFVGDPVAVVIADSRYIAEDAAELVYVDYEPLPAQADYITAVGSDELVHEEFPGNIFTEVSILPEETMQEMYAIAAHVVSETFYQQAYAAVPLETRGIVVEYSAPSQEMTIWTATQAPHEVRAVASRLLDLPEQKIRVIMRDTGGGFGQKVIPQREDFTIMLAARKVPAPIKWIEDRRENLMSAGQARHEHGTATMAFDEDGAIIAADINFVQDVGAYPTPAPGTPAFAVGMFFPGPYRIPLANFTAKVVLSNTPGRTAYRGPWQFESVAREMLMDCAARQMGVDPIELRRKNMITQEELPTANAIGFPYENISPLETLNQAVEMLGYEEFRAKQAEAFAEGRLLGVGTSTYVEPTSAGAGFYGSEGATIRIEPSGKVNVYVAGGSTGNSLETTVIQLAADALGVNIEDVNTIQGDTAVTPFGAGTGGSRSGSMTAGAVGQVAATLREKLVTIAAHHLEAAEPDIELVGSRAIVRGTPSIGVSIEELANKAYFNPGALPEGMEPGLEASGRYKAQSAAVLANASHLCTVEVDPVTGDVEILRYIVSEDCGKMINPNVVEGQIAGGSVQGIGGVLLEQLDWDADGNPLVTTFVDYLLPTSTEVPDIEYGHIETPANGPGGYKGVGEGGAIGAPPAVANAIADALAQIGVKVTHLPLSPAAIVGMIEDQTESASA